MQDAQGKRRLPADLKQVDRVQRGACLSIGPISYLASGQRVEFTRSFYRGDTSDFVAELI